MSSSPSTITALDGRSLVRTQVTARLDEPLSAGSNLLFCSTFQLAWNELRAALGGAIRLQGDPLLAVALEREGPTADDLDVGSYVARGGVGPGFLREVERALRQTFGDRDDFMLPGRLEPSAILAYAYLSKDLAFRTPFEVERKLGIVFHGGERVACFGVWGAQEDPLRAKRAAQVVVHHVSEGGSFVLELITDAEADRLIVACIPREPSLLAMVDEALARANHKPGLWSRLRGEVALGKRDVVKIPMIDVDVLRNYAEIGQRKVLDQEHVIEEAKQRIRFRLDEKGAILRSAGVIVAPRGGPRGRHFVCDRPFLVAMVRAGRRYPYFAAWIEDPELLVAVRPEP
ncbi:hypothetical protein [Chondromyces crocatus]|uniref:Serpin domain-containing protein n=1 Tax=Chondromyces crocatus TaxID=52 RepID=A0A0K1E812_CHOCO|nr:hypothetical protein [Chondromyces crocatus]AKT37021.1 uncharacterized protein CMC5_011470 [Chondromyces crocatus]